MMRIIHIASECAPLAKVGGLADVVSGLSKELFSRGEAVEVLLPKYRSLNTDLLDFLDCLPGEVSCFFQGRLIKNRVWKAAWQGIPLTLLDPELPFFQGESIYPEGEEERTFAYFSRAALELLLARDEVIDILHLHDWHTSLVPLLHRELFAPRGLKVGAQILTIHNIQHQGVAHFSLLEEIGCNSHFYNNLYDLQDPKRTDYINFLKGGIIHSRFVNTVSPSYAKEILEVPGGSGLEGVLRHYAYKCRGILNGLDTTYWDPSVDTFLHLNYSPQEGIDTFFAKKQWCKHFLQEKLSLHSSPAPLVACISRLVPQKGIDLLEHSLHTTLSQGGQWVLLGSSPIPQIQQRFEALACRFNNSGQAHLELHHDEPLAHQIFAGADLFLVPSLFEPCGLTQMIAMHYGALPVVRRTGGLKDTVRDLDDGYAPWETRNGFCFDHPDNAGIDWALNRALNRFKHDPWGWRSVAYRAASQDRSWRHPASTYLALYKEALFD